MQLVLIPQKLETCHIYIKHMGVVGIKIEQPGKIGFLFSEMKL